MMIEWFITCSSANIRTIVSTDWLPCKHDLHRKRSNCFNAMKFNIRKKFFFLSIENFNLPSSASYLSFWFSNRFLQNSWLKWEKYSIKNKSNRKKKNNYLQLISSVCCPIGNSWIDIIRNLNWPISFNINHDFFGLSQLRLRKNKY